MIIPEILTNVNLELTFVDEFIGVTARQKKLSIAVFHRVLPSFTTCPGFSHLLPRFFPCPYATVSTMNITCTDPLHHNKTRKAQHYRVLPRSTAFFHLQPVSNLSSHGTVASMNITFTGLQVSLQISLPVHCHFISGAQQTTFATLPSRKRGAA